MPRYSIPRLPVFGWQTLSGPTQAGVPCMLDLPGARCTTSGRASILLALEALGVGTGHQVLLPTYHCPTMVAPVMHLHAEPKFYPITETGAPNLDWLASQNLSRVRVLLVAHLFGLPQPMAAVRAWCDARGIALLEDCAHALFGRSGDRPIGAWGDLAIGSFTKFLPMTTGGCLVSGVAAVAPLRRVRDWRDSARVLLDALEIAAQHGRLLGLNRAVLAMMRIARSLRHGAPMVEPEFEAVPAAPPDLSSLGSLDAWLAHQELPWVGRWLAASVPRGRIVELRRRRYLELTQRLSGHQGLRPLMPDLADHCAPYVFPLWVDAPDPGYARLRALRMPVSRWDWLWPGVPTIERDRGVIWSRHVLQLACHQDISDADLNRIVEVLLDLYAVSPLSARPKSGAELENA